MRRTTDTFMKHVDIDDDTGCWRWTGASTQSGYAQYWDGHRVRAARAWLHEQRGRDIPRGQFISLTCGNRMCVNPEHFHLVTHPGGEHNREKTHCPRGHEYDAANTYIRPDRSRGRQCRQCRKDQRPKWRRG